MMRFLVGAVLLASLCASAFADPVSIGDLMPSYMGGDLELAIIPTPQEVEYGQKLFPVGGKVEIDMPAGDYDGPRTVVEQLNKILDGSEHKGTTHIIVGEPSRNREAGELLKKAGVKMPAKRGEDAYALYIGEGADGQLSIVLAGSTPAGDFWACQTLRQLTCKVDGVVYVRGAKIRDWPDFPYRGNKRPKRWEYRFKANYAWGYPGDKPEHAEVFRRHGAWIQHIGKLDTSKARIDELCADARKRYEKGCREFVLKYDDTGQGMTRKTAARFKKNYYKAQVYFLSTMYERIKKWDVRNTVFFMPQQYWANALDILNYTQGIREAGGLPEGMGLSFCGQEVTSETIPLQCVTTYQKLFGLTEQRVQIYDNLCRGGDWAACAGRDPDLPKAVQCIFNERGSAVARITTYDYLWNAQDYNPERSLKLTCRELAGREPGCYRALYDYISTWNRERDRAGELPRKEAIAQLKRSLPVLKNKYKNLVPLLKESELAEKARVAETLRGKVWHWGETAALARREAFQDFMIAHGYQEIRARKTDRTVKIDGKLDESAWEKADIQTDFVPLGGKKVPDSKIPQEKQTEIRVLYDEANLYIGVVMHSTKEPKIPRWGKRHAPGTEANFGWRLPCVEICLDPDHDHVDYFHLQLNLAGWYSENNANGWESSVRSGVWFNSGLTFRRTVGDKESVIEAAIPFVGLVASPKPGDRWGAQFCRNLEGYSTWSFMYDFSGFRCPHHYGTLIFE